MEARKIDDLWDPSGMGSERKVRQQQMFCYRVVDEMEGIGPGGENGDRLLACLLPWPSLLSFKNSISQQNIAFKT